MDAAAVPEGSGEPRGGAPVGREGSGEPRDRRAGLVGGLVLAAVVLALLVPFAGADPPAGLTGSNATWTDEGFNLANARQRVLFGEFATGDVDRSLTNGVYSAVAAGVLAVRAPWRPSPWAGAGLGLALAAAVSVKAVAVVPAAAMLAVVLAAALKRRHRAALVMGLVALGTALAAGLVWLVAVALPNADRLRTGLEIWPHVSYLAPPWTLAGRLGRYLAEGGDGAAWRSLPLLAAAGLGLAALVGRWRRIGRAARDALVIAALWGVGLWAALGAGDYLPAHYAAPNRYVVPALPGLAVLAGFGLAWLAGGLWRGRATVATVLALAVAVPGAAGYLSAAVASGHQRERDQRVLAARLPSHAVVFGAYAPTLLFDTGTEVVTAWPPAGANVDDPVGRFGVSHVLATDPADASDPIGQIPAFRDLRGLTVLARVRWGGRTIGLYGVAASPGAPAAR